MISATTDKISEFVRGSGGKFYENNNFVVSRSHSTEPRRVTMFRKWIFYSVSMFAVAFMFSGTTGRASDFTGLRMSPPTIPYKPGYGSLRAGGGDHFVGAWLHGCSCRRPGEPHPVFYRRTNPAVYASTSSSMNNSSEPTQTIPPAPSPSNVASK